MRTVKDFFKEVKGNLSVIDVYSAYLKGVMDSGGEFPLVYISGALTSGGYRRNGELSFEEGFSKNAELSAQIRIALYTNNVLDANRLIFFPGDTATATGWRQFEYNLFFGLTLLNVNNLKDLESLIEYVKSNVDMHGFINDRSSREDRIKSYESLVNTLAEYVVDHSIKITPVKEVVQILDNDMSLGSWYEAELGKRFGAKILRVKVNKLASNINAIKEIVDQITTLESFGMDFFTDPNGGERQEAIYLVES